MKYCFGETKVHNSRNVINYLTKQRFRLGNEKFIEAAHWILDRIDAYTERRWKRNGVMPEPKISTLM